MKKILYTVVFAAALLATSCAKDDDNINTPKTYKIGFEDVTLNEQGRSWGVDTKTMDRYELYKIYNTKTEGIDSMLTYISDTPATFWCNWAVSNNNLSTAQSDYSHQYSTPLGACTGSKYAVCYYAEYMGPAYAPAVKFHEAVNIKSLMLTNGTPVLLYISKQDSHSQWEDTDKLTLVIEGANNGTSCGTVEVFLAEGSNYISTWTAVDLSKLGTVDKLSFKMTSTDVGNWGINTPTYACIDDITYQK